MRLGKDAEGGKAQATLQTPCSAQEQGTPVFRHKPLDVEVAHDGRDEMYVPHRHAACAEPVRYGGYCPVAVGYKMQPVVAFQRASDALSEAQRMDVADLFFHIPIIK